MLMIFFLDVSSCGLVYGYILELLPFEPKTWSFCMLNNHTCTKHLEAMFGDTKFYKVF